MATGSSNKKSKLNTILIPVSIKDKITINSIEQDTSFLNDEASTNDAQTMEKMYEDLQK